ncbi:nitrogenase component 1 [Fervidobacterium sp.]
MPLFKHLPIPSERIGGLWTLSSIKDAVILEYGPAGTTHYALETVATLNAELRANLYTTHMSEKDLVIGIHDRLIKSVEEIDRLYNPQYIFVIPSSVISVVGADVDKVLRDISYRVKSKVFALHLDDFDRDYTSGIKKTLSFIANEIVEEVPEKDPKLYNLIGVNIDQYNFLSDVNEISRIMYGCFGMRLNAVFTSYSSIQDLKSASRAGLNIVVRNEALESAIIMKKKFSIPYHYGIPYGINGTINFVKSIESLLKIKSNQEFLNQELRLCSKAVASFKKELKRTDDLNVWLSGNVDLVVGLATFMENELLLPVSKVFVIHSFDNEDFLKRYKELLPNTEFIFNANGDLYEVLIVEGETILLGDGLFIDIVNKNKKVISIQVANPNLSSVKVCNFLPFVGFRGTLYLIENLFNQMNSKTRTIGIN